MKTRLSLSYIVRINHCLISQFIQYTMTDVCTDECCVYSYCTTCNTVFCIIDDLSYVLIFKQFYNMKRIILYSMYCICIVQVQTRIVKWSFEYTLQVVLSHCSTFTLYCRTNCSTSVRDFESDSNECVSKQITSELSIKKLSTRSPTSPSELTRHMGDGDWQRGRRHIGEELNLDSKIDTEYMVSYHTNV